MTTALTLPLVPVHDNGRAGWVVLVLIVLIVVIGAVVGVVRSGRK